MNSAKQLNQEFLEAVKQAIPADTNLVKVIEAELRIGREGIYRRIRGDVPFTFNEVVALCLKFGMSLDRFLGISHKMTAVFDLNLINSDQPLEDYLNMLAIDVEMFKEFNRKPESRVHMAYNMIPFTFFNGHELLWRFSIYRLIHQLEKDKRVVKFSELQIPDGLSMMRNKLFNAYSNVHWSSYILDRKVFTSMIKEIFYFTQLGLISAADCKKLKEEMLSLLDELDLVMTTGKYRSGNDMIIYLSNIDLEASYCCYECPELNFSHLRLYRIAVLNSSSPNVFEVQKEYIESLKRFSTLVTVSGELERNIFLNLQREQLEIL